ncbi:MAG: hypothetical protein COA45_07425 [Zetaproteobacteria bacterium]|nr:MAG: hypothetical protein COA45_07425 [Zetaproteobacteria bacterium]
MRIKRILMLAFVSMCALGVSGGASAQNLREAVVYALENHPAIEGARLGYGAAEHSKSAVFSEFFPEVSIGITAGRTYQDNATSRGLSVTRGAAYSGIGEGNIVLRQMLFDGFEVRNRVRSADARVKSLSYTLLDVEGLVSLRVAQSYVDILRISHALKILSEQAVSIKDYERRITDMVSEGVADEVELQQARDVAMVIDGISVEYQGQLISARAMYVEAAGQAFRDGVKYTPASLASFIVENLTSAVARAKENHPALQSARMDSKAARHEMRAEYARMYPDLNGELSYAKTDKKDLIGGESQDARAVIRLSWNFSTGGKAFSTMRQKRYEHYEIAARHEALSREVERDIYQAYANYNTLKRKFTLSVERVGLNDKLMSAYEAKFEGSRISLLDLMRAESQLFNARLAENDNKYYLLSAEYGVLSSLGTLKDVLISAQTGE